jgi:hypothetical protein
LFGSSREPDEDGADIGAVRSKSKGIRRIFMGHRASASISSSARTSGHPVWHQKINP